MNLDEINPFRTERASELICLADVAPRSVDWLWWLRIAYGMLTMLSGDPGCGKTYLALSIAAALSLGRLLDPRTVEPTSTIYWSRENPIAESIRPRFDALGGDPSRFFIRQNGSLADIEGLESDLRDTGARFLIIDPLQSFLGAGVDLHRSNETRPVLDGLADVAERNRCAILLLRHLSKSGAGTKASHRGLGSIDITAAGRSELLAGILPSNSRERALIHTKSNCGPLAPSLKYAIDGEGFRWLGECSIRAESLLEVPRAGGGKLLEVGMWLRSFLAGGTKSADEVEAEAKAKGFSWATVHRARKELRVISEKQLVSGEWHWRLRDDSMGKMLTPMDTEILEHLEHVECVQGVQEDHVVQEDQGVQEDHVVQEDQGVQEIYVDQRLSTKRTRLIKRSSLDGEPIPAVETEHPRPNGRVSI